MSCKSDVCYTLQLLNVLFWEDMPVDSALKFFTQKYRHHLVATYALKTLEQTPTVATDGPYFCVVHYLVSFVGFHFRDNPSISARITS